jgi:uncharacterized protein with PIN domain
LLRYRCPRCDQVLRQEAALTSEAPRATVSRAESGYRAGAAVCPACGELVQIVARGEDILETHP